MRVTHDISMPMAENLSVINPEGCIVRWSERSSIDIGQICFKIRATSSSKRKNHKFDASSIDESRCSAIPKLLRALSDLQKYKGYRPSTMARTGRCFLEFIKYCDSNNICFDLNNPEETRDALHDYVRRARSIIKTKKASASTTESGRQQEIVKLLRALYRDDNWGAGIPILKARRANIQHTEVPTDTEVGINYHSCVTAFNAIADHVLKNEEYPIVINGLKGLDGAERSVLLPCVLNKNKYESTCWDPDTGKPLTYEKVRDKTSGPFHRQKAYAAAKRARKISEEADKPRSLIRLKHASFASSCFSAALLAETGTPLQNLIDLDETPFPKKGRQNYRTLKFRAGGRPVDIEISYKFTPLLLKYLELRRYILGDELDDALLIVLDASNKPGRLSPSFLHYLKVRFKRLGIVFPHIPSRKFRAKKQDFAIVNSTPEQAAAIMQHSIETAKASYTNGSTEAQAKEVGGFFRALSITAKKRSSAEVQNSVGSCTSINNPKAIDAIPFINLEPLCEVAQGCLFCKKNRIHADEVDALKLLSAKLYINSLASISYEGSETLIRLQKTLARLNDILSELQTALGNEAFQKIETDVAEGRRVHGFWEAKINQLIFMGVL